MAALDDMGDVELAWRGVLTSGLEKLRIENMLCDTTIATSDGQSLSCHSCVLAAACPVLQVRLIGVVCEISNRQLDHSASSHPVSRQSCLRFGQKNS